MQAFNDEDPQGRRTLGNFGFLALPLEKVAFLRFVIPLSPHMHVCNMMKIVILSGLFLHLRKAENMDAQQKVSYFLAYLIYMNTF